VHRYLAELPGVTAVHDLHIWGMSTTETALTAHLVRAAGADDALSPAPRRRSTTGSESSTAPQPATSALLSPRKPRSTTRVTAFVQLWITLFAGEIK
jgi:hypothetical protein